MTTILPDPRTEEELRALRDARDAVSRMAEPCTEFGRVLFGNKEERVQNLAHDLLLGRFKAAVKPLEDMKARVLTLDLDARVTLVLKDGLLERLDTEPSPQAKKALAALDELIKAESRRFGFSRD